MRTSVTAAGTSVPIWLVVNRFGAAGEHLTLGWDGAAIADGPAPADLAPGWTAFGALVEAGDAPAFRLARALPAGLAVPKRFFACDGSVRLHGDHGALRLLATGCTVGAGPVVGDWRLDAERRPWLGEVPPD